MNLVTGGAGFIGSHLVSLLAAQGEPVRVLELPGARCDHLPASVEIVRGDIRDRAAMREATRGCRRVYHLAADPNLWRRNRDEFDQINHQGSVNVLQAALDNGAERILYTSTESILASRRPEDGPVERLRLDERQIFGRYCLSKFRAEEAAFRLTEQGAPIVVATPTIPIGPGDRNHTPLTRMTLAFCRGTLPAYLETSFNLIDARDVAQGMVAAMDRGRPGLRYLLGHANVPLSEWLRGVGAEIGRAVPRWRVPYAVALAAAWCNERWADHVSRTMPMATITGVRLTRRAMSFDASASLAELALQPRHHRESARDAIQFYRTQGWI